jgi:Putative Actinobacterial Holin-X, holin superfamily III
MRDDEPGGPEEVVEETWPQRVRAFFESLGNLLSTRAEIFKEELGAKGVALGQAAVAFFLAAAFALLALLLLTAGLAALLSRLFGSPVAGILVTFVLFAGAAALAAYLGVRALTRGNLFEFPVTAEEIRKDWKVIVSAATPEPPDTGGGERDAVVASGSSAADDLEARFRVGSE